MKEKAKVYFEQRKEWDDAVKDTNDDLIPLAVMLHKVKSLPEIAETIKVSDDYHPFALIAMTTRFLDVEKDGQLGWIHLDTEVKQTLSNLIYDNKMMDEWIYFAQTYADDD